MKKTIYMDCTELVYSNSKTGIQRVERNIICSASELCEEFSLAVFPVAFLGKLAGLRKLLKIDTGNTLSFKLGYFESVYLCLLSPNKLKKLSKASLPFFSDWLEIKWNRFRFMLLPILAVYLFPIALISTIIVLSKKEKVNMKEGDVYFIPGSSWLAHDLTVPLKTTKKANGNVVILLHDLIFLSHPEYFNVSTINIYNSKINTFIDTTDLIISVSKFTKNELRLFFKRKKINVIPKLTTNYSGFKLDLINSNSIIRLGLFNKVENAYISIGTIEPRKNYDYLLNAFDLILNKKQNVKLCIIGKYGWKSEDLVNRILTHPQYDKNLFWFSDLNDKELMYAYEHAKACVYPSIVEGFGLPLIEALSLRCPVLASDIPVFHEIGGEYCHYFSLDNPGSLVQLVEKVENFGLLDNLDYLDSFSWPDWKQSTSGLLTKILNI